MNPKIIEIEMLLDKINSLYRNFKNEDSHVSKVETDLFKDYALQLYAKLVEYETQKSIKIHQPLVQDMPKQELPKQQLFVPLEEKKVIEIKKDEPISIPVEEKPMLEVKEEKIIVVDEKKIEAKNIIVPTTEKVIKKSLGIVDDDENDSNENIAGLNIKLSKEKTTLAEKIGGKKNTDLRNAIDLNDKFYFIRELFKGDHNAFDKAIRYLNGLTNFDDAKQFIQKDLALNYNWSNADSVDKLLDVIKIKFE